ncbi:hypothetical protein WMO40_14690 [Bacillaceae bacterium CLA-AA-H227]|uniref:Uncharacterized protein n=1 Tax=Robertmurraya yapensis (ex Hitch et al 2024) TaxID=3133160 RepID=A0ACC6SCZ6_9BACI
MKRKGKTTLLSIIISVTFVSTLTYFSISAFSKENTSRGQAYEREAKEIEKTVPPRKEAVGSTAPIVENRPTLQPKERPERPALGRPELEKVSGFKGKLKRVHSNGK